MVCWEWPVMRNKAVVDEPQIPRLNRKPQTANSKPQTANQVYSKSLYFWQNLKFKDKKPAT
jgi:hypothetical protein